MNLKEAKQAIRAFIRAHWSDQKLADAYCFNRDGKMSGVDPCCCFLGVTFSTVLHESDYLHPCPEAKSHYDAAASLPGADEAERAYCVELGVRRGRLAQRAILSAILRAEMKRRARRDDDLLAWIILGRARVDGLREEAR